MLVVDGSAILDALVADPPKAALMGRLLADGDLHAPHLIDLEILSALRHLVATGELAVGGAEQARAGLIAIGLRRYSHAGLLDRVWKLRHHLTAYDAAYIALSEALDAPLVTTDGRLARAGGHQAEVELY